jgi:hypothetical protein
MAGKDTLFAQVVIAGEYKNLAKSTRGAAKELKGFEATTKKMANAVKGALAGIALMGVGAVFDALVDMTKAAQEDAKSMALLNKQMEKSWKATDTTKESMNAYIDSVARMTGIMDDDLRPAFGKIVRATKNASQATAAFDNVLNIAADRQLDVNTVANAYSKYLAGNKTALYRLIPGLKGARNEAEYLKNTFAGMAKIAGDNNPFARITVIMEDFKEKLGTAFLPLIQQFADWLGSDEATKALDDLATAVQNAFKWFGSEEGKAGIKEFGDAVLVLVDGLTEMVKQIKIISKFAESSPLMLLINGINEFNKPYSKRDQSSMMTPGGQGTGKFRVDIAPKASTTPITVAPAKPANINIVVNAPNTSGTAVLDALKRAANARGIPMSKLLG